MRFGWHRATGSGDGRRSTPHRCAHRTELPARLRSSGWVEPACGRGLLVRPARPEHMDLHRPVRSSQRDQGPVAGRSGCDRVAHRSRLRARRRRSSNEHRDTSRRRRGAHRVRLVHLLYLAPDVAEFDRRRSWIVPAAARRSLSGALMVATVGAFALLGLAVWGLAGVRATRGPRSRPSHPRARCCCSARSATYACCSACHRCRRAGSRVARAAVGRGPAGVSGRPRIVGCQPTTHRPTRGRRRWRRSCRRTLVLRDTQDDRPWLPGRSALRRSAIAVTLDHRQVRDGRGGG